MAFGFGLRLGLSDTGFGVGASFSVSIGSGAVETGTLLTATVSGLEGGETVTYQWTDDGVDIPLATSATYTAAIGTDSVADASLIGVTAIVDGGDPITSGTREIRYPAGSVTESALADWTIDDDALNVNLASDFTTTNLTGTYVIAGLPTGAVDDGDGTISGEVDGTAEVPATESLTATFTDQYGRTIVGNYAVDTVYRAQATGGADLDLSFAEGTPTVNEDLTANWTTNGNTLTYALVTPPSLPTNLSVSSAGLLTRSGSVSVTADDTYTLRGTDEYGRTTDDTLTLEITEVDVTAPTASSISAGTQQADGDVPITVTSLDENSTAGWVLTSSDQSAALNTDVKAAAEGGTALTDQVDFGTFSATTGGGPYEEAITSGLAEATYYLQVVFWDAVPNTSAVYSSSTTIKTTSPTISSSSPADNATDVAIAANPTVTFDASVQFGTGNITLYDVTNTVNEEVFDVAVDTGGGAGTVSISGAVLTIEPTADLSNSVEYAIKIDATAIDDTTGNSFAGVTDNTTLSFTTVSGVTNLFTAPGDFTDPAWSVGLAYTVTDADTLSYGGSGTNKTFQERITISGGTASKTFKVSAMVDGTGTFRFSNVHGGVVANYSPDITLSGTPTLRSFEVTNSGSAGDGDMLAGFSSPTNPATNFTINVSSLVFEEV